MKKVVMNEKNNFIEPYNAAILDCEKKSHKTNRRFIFHLATVAVIVNVEKRDPLESIKYLSSLVR